jgi:hypothetical protein
MGLRVRHMPRLQEEIELHPDVIVPHRRKARDLDRVWADLFGDIVTLLEEGDEAVEIGGVLNSNSHRWLFALVSAPWPAQLSLRARDFPYSMRVGPNRTGLEGGPTWLI